MHEALSGRVTLLHIIHLAQLQQLLVSIVQHPVQELLGVLLLPLQALGFPGSQHLQCNMSSQVWLVDLLTLQAGVAISISTANVFTMLSAQNSSCT